MRRTCDLTLHIAENGASVTQRVTDESLEQVAWTVYHSKCQGSLNLSASMTPNLYNALPDRRHVGFTADAWMLQHEASRGEAHGNLLR
jgi:hypothetical protein